MKMMSDYLKKLEEKWAEESWMLNPPKNDESNEVVKAFNVLFSIMRKKMWDDNSETETDK